MQDLTFVVFTNQLYFNILDLTLPTLIENNKHLGVEFVVVSNHIPHNSLLRNDVRYIDCGVPFNPSGTHFSACMRHALKHINTNYIFFNCDDYLFLYPTKKEIFGGLFDVLIEVGGDLLSFATQKHMEYLIDNWKKVEHSNTQIPSNCLLEMDKKYKHYFSVQPCIWKKETLQRILDFNNNLRLHEMDNSLLLNESGEIRNQKIIYDMLYVDELDLGVKGLCIYYPPYSYHVDEKPMGADYFSIGYTEIIKNGKFLNAHVNTSDIIQDKIFSSEVYKTNEHKYKIFKH